MSFTRRDFVKGGVGLTLASTVPFARNAFAQAENDRIVAASKAIGKTDLRGMIWSNYYIPMQPSMEDFRKLTGIGVGGIQDISIFDIPQRAMAEALSRSPQFDFFHVDAGMIPSLASAGLLEPLDAYMKKANFKIDAVGEYNKLFTYRGQTWGVPTDGNVHNQYVRKDLLEDPDAQKRFADRFGKPLKFPETWDDEFQIQHFFHNPEKNLWGSGNLRNRANGVTWYLMMLYSHGGFPFDDEMNPTLNTEAGKQALQVYLREKTVAHPESPGWGTPQMIPRNVGGLTVAFQYWDGTIKQNENKEKSKTAGKWLYGIPPGAMVNGKLRHRAISSPMPRLAPVTMAIRPSNLPMLPSPSRSNLPIYSAASARAPTSSHSGASPPSCGVGRVQCGWDSDNLRIGPRCRSGPLFGRLSIRTASSSAAERSRPSPGNATFPWRKMNMPDWHSDTRT